jgi:ribosomal protein S18 acetylase RimI-like enzyme
MAELRMRPMTSAEYDGFRAKLIGRALLEAAERETAARGLYESSGYEITTVQMRKALLTGD